MHGISIYPVNGIELFGKPIFYFDKTVTIQRGIAGAVSGGIVPIRFTACFPPFGDLAPFASDTVLQDFIADCVILTQFYESAPITQGSYTLKYNDNQATFEDFLLEKNLSGTAPGDDMGSLLHPFIMHHTVCDNPSLPSEITTLSIQVHGVGIYAGLNKIDYL